MDYEDYKDYEPTDEFTEKLNLLVAEEVKSKIKQTVDELESLRHEYSLQSTELSKARGEIKDCELKVRQAVKQAQREYWFDCAVGDRVFVLEGIRKTKKCEKCSGSQKVNVIVDSVEVKAECPICGTYEKRRAMEFWEYSIVEVIVYRLQIELTNDHKWIKIWDRNRDREYSLEYSKVFRTMEECQAAYDAKTKEEHHAKN